MPDGSIGVNDDEPGPARKIGTILLMNFYMLPYYRSETRLEDDLPAEYKSAGRGTYGGGAADADGIAIVTGGCGGAPDCAGGANRRAEGPALGTRPVARGAAALAYDMSKYKHQDGEHTPAHASHAGPPHLAFVPTHHLVPTFHRANWSHPM